MNNQIDTLYNKIMEYRQTRSHLHEIKSYIAKQESEIENLEFSTYHTKVMSPEDISQIYNQHNLLLQEKIETEESMELMLRSISYFCLKIARERSPVSAEP